METDKAKAGATVQAVKRTFDEVLKIIMARYGIGHQAAVQKMKQFDFTLEELQKVAAKNKTKVTVHAEQPKPDDDREPDDDADEKLDKLAIAIQRAHPDAKFSKAQATAWAIDHLPEARELVRLSKRRSIGRYGEQATGHFDKAESSVSQTLPLTQPDVVRDPADRADFDAGQARVDDGRRTADGGDFDAKVKQLMNEEGLSHDEAMSRLVRQAREERIAKVGW